MYMWKRRSSKNSNIFQHNPTYLGILWDYLDLSVYIYIIYIYVELEYIYLLGICWGLEYRNIWIWDYWDYLGISMIIYVSLENVGIWNIYIYIYVYIYNIIYHISIYLDLPKIPTYCG